LIHDVSRPGYPGLFAAAGRKKATGDVLVKVVNASNSPQAAQIRISGMPGLSSQAKTITLAHADAEAENSVSDPLRIAPRESTTEGISPEFSHTFPANALTVLFLRAGRR